ncbi:MAG: hypothetical protein COA74_13580 [Gammaproteobacteria bacterium]|nr:MAG: hypothetical protein COA74_13580 [Gammaproteobacteria bacterium]
MLKRKVGAVKFEEIRGVSLSKGKGARSHFGQIKIDLASDIRYLQGKDICFGHTKKLCSIIKDIDNILRKIKLFNWKNTVLEALGFAKILLSTCNIPLANLNS